MFHQMFHCFCLHNQDYAALLSKEQPPSPETGEFAVVMFAAAMSSVYVVTPSDRDYPPQVGF